MKSSYAPPAGSPAPPHATSWGEVSLFLTKLVSLAFSTVRILVIYLHWRPIIVEEFSWGAWSLYSLENRSTYHGPVDDLHSGFVDAGYGKEHRTLRIALEQIWDGCSERAASCPVSSRYIV